jgi:mono/diheme cytochrome c family protein
VLLGITTEGKIGLAALAGAFIVFALIVSFVLPRRNPDFPGDRLGLFIAVALAFFVATMAGVVFFAKEEEEAGHGAETTEHVETETETETETEAGATTAEEAEEPPVTEGDAAAGEEVFASAGCGGCHTLEAAGSTGNVGPNLDEAQPDAALVEQRVRNGAGAMPAFEGQLSDDEIADVTAYVVESTS